MTEEIKTCDFYNEKICTLFSKYFGFNVECKNLSLSTIDSDIERECPIKRLEQENKDFEILAKSLYKRIEELEKENEALAFRERLYKADYEASEQENKELKEKVKELDKMTGIFSARLCNKYRSVLEKIKDLCMHYENTDDKCITNCYAHFIVTDLIQDKVDEVLK